MNDDLRKLIEEYKEKGKLNILNKDEKFSNTKYDNLIVQFSKKYSVDPALVKIMMYQESKFNPRARSGGRAR
ncbi:MAG: transglycosylase SLT domain-containing protein [Methanobrevibacter sp.]|nr:transglycosylase SLT domain-containing protein [Methanobrevibacter sp.]